MIVVHSRAMGNDGRMSFVIKIQEGEEMPDMSDPMVVEHVGMEYSLTGLYKRTDTTFHAVGIPRERRMGVWHRPENEVPHASGQYLIRMERPWVSLEMQEMVEDYDNLPYYTDVWWDGISAWYSLNNGSVIPRKDITAWTFIPEYDLAENP